MNANRRIQTRVEREIIRTARRIWVKELMLRDPVSDEFDIDVPFSFIEPVKDSSFEAVHDGQKRLRACGDVNGSSPNLDCSVYLLDSNVARYVSELALLTYKSTGAINVVANAASQILTSSLEVGAVVQQYKKKLDLGNQRKFWSFFDDLHSTREAIPGLRCEFPPRHLFSGLDRSRYWTDIEYQLCVSLDDIQSFWDQVAECNSNIPSSPYDLENFLRSAFEQRIWKVTRVRARVRFCSPTTQRANPNNIREQIFGFVIHTGNSPPCESAQVCSLVRSLLEKSHVAFWKFSCTKNIPRALCKRRARRRRDTGSSSTRRSRGSFESRGGAPSRTRTYRETATLKTTSLLCARIGQMVVKLQLAA
jgi:hypothetical protein